MAEPTGTARQEAERLVATVLAMASQAGLGGPPKDRDPAGPPKDRDPAGPAGLTDMISGLVGQFTGGTPDPPRATGRETPGPGADSRPAADPRGVGDEQEWDWREAYQHTLDSLGAAARSRARQAAGRQLWEGVTRFGGWSTGSAECCMCPICRAIAGVRNPSPEQAERLATGAGDLASGVAGVLRAFSTVTGATGSPGRKPPARPATTPDQAWSAATRRARPAESPAAAHEVREDDDPWTAATRASRAEPQAGKARAEQAATQSDVTGQAPESGDPWAAATASGGTGPAPGGAGAWVVTAGGSVSQPAPAGGGASRDRRPESPGGDARAAEQAAVQSDAVGSVGAGPRGPVQGDPWAAATRAAERPASARRAGAAVPEAGGAGTTGHSAVTPGAGGADVAAPGAGEAAPEASEAAPRAGEAGGAALRASAAAAGRGSAQAAPTAAAQPTADPAPDAHRAPAGDPAAAVGEAGARTGEEPGQAETGSRPAPGTGRTPTAPSSLRGRLADNGPGASRRVTGATDVWAAVTAANGDTAGDTGVAHTPSVDHDVPGTAPAAEAAEGRGAGPGDDARSGDAV